MNDLSIKIYVGYTLNISTENEIDIELVKAAIEKEFESTPPRERMIVIEDSEGNEIIREWLQDDGIYHGDQAALAIGYSNID